MSSRIKEALGTIIAIALIFFAITATAKDVNVLSFSFEVPESWSVEGNGRGTLFATGATRANTAPIIMAEACDQSNKLRCSEKFRRPNPAKELQKEGCAGVTGQVVTRTDQIVETRWICSPVTIDGIRVTTGISLFEINGSILSVSYLAGDRDQVVSTFLEIVGRSLKVKQ